MKLVPMNNNRHGYVRATGAAPRATLMIALVALGIVMVAPIGALNIAAAKGEDKKKTEPAFVNDPSVDLMKDVEANPKLYKKLIEAARDYFDVDEEKWKSRLAFIGALEMLQAQKKRDPLSDTKFLSWLCAQSRAFHPQMAETKWRKGQNITSFKKHSGTSFTIKTPSYWMHVSPPKNYPKKNKEFDAFPRAKPWPTLISLHDKSDYSGKEYPGMTMLKKRWPKGEFGELYQKWLVCAPITAAGQFVRSGQVDRGSFDSPWAMVFRHYHVDFDHVVLDGVAPIVTTIAASRAVYLSGIIVRSGFLTDDDKAIVQNYAHTPVYVVDDKKLAKTMREAGHKNVTDGDGKDLMTWMSALRRKRPTTFTWNANTDDKVLAHWISIASLDHRASEKTLDVKVDNNDIDIRARGVTEIALFLDDTLVDLDKPVKVTINGHLAYKSAVVGKPDDDQTKLTRPFDLIFDRKPIELRQSMYFGWLMPGRIVGLEVRPPADATTDKKKPDDNASSVEPKKFEASEKEENDAKRYFTKAQEAHKSGDKGKASRLLKKVLGLPHNRQSVAAKKLLAEIEG